MDGIPQSGSYTLSQHVFQIFPTVILRCVTPQKAGDSMNIGIVGAGKVGFSFGRLLAEKGVRISGYYSRNSDSAREAAEFTNSGHYTDLGKLIEDSDAIFITVPDNAITEVYRQGAEFEIQDKYICHCSGACTAEEAFPGIHAQGAYAISIHLLFPISSKYNCWRELAGAFFCVEGDAQAVEVFVPLLRGLGLQVQTISPESKAQYHLSCALASNFVCALVQRSAELLGGCGFSEEDALRALTPLMRSNLAHVIEYGAVSALTGPIERGDTQTVQKHLSCLTERDDRQLYALLGLEQVKMAQEKHPEQDYGTLAALLNREKEQNE